MRISDWSSDVCSSDLHILYSRTDFPAHSRLASTLLAKQRWAGHEQTLYFARFAGCHPLGRGGAGACSGEQAGHRSAAAGRCDDRRSEEHTSELQSLLRNLFDVFHFKTNIHNNRVDMQVTTEGIHLMNNRY